MACDARLLECHIRSWSLAASRSFGHEPVMLALACPGETALLAGRHNRGRASPFPVSRVLAHIAPLLSVCHPPGGHHSSSPVHPGLPHPAPYAHALASASTRCSSTELVRLLSSEHHLQDSKSRVATPRCLGVSRRRPFPAVASRASTDRPRFLGIQSALPHLTRSIDASCFHVAGLVHPQSPLTWPTVSAARRANARARSNRPATLTTLASRSVYRRLPRIGFPLSASTSPSDSFPAAAATSTRPSRRSDRGRSTRRQSLETHPERRIPLRIHSQSDPPPKRLLRPVAPSSSTSTESACSPRCHSPRYPEATWEAGVDDDRPNLCQP